MLQYPTKFDPKRYGNTYLQFYSIHDVFHPGADFNYGFGNDDKGQNVCAPTWGYVEYVSPIGFNGGLGNYIVLYHPHNGAWTRYLHLDQTFVRIGQKVAPGEVIGLLGATGTTSAHLHFEVLTYEGLCWIRDYYRPYGRYPEGMQKKEVASLWKDPILWLETEKHYIGPSIQTRLEQAQNALRWASDLRRNMLLRLINRLTALL